MSDPMQVGKIEFGPERKGYEQAIGAVPLPDGAMSAEDAIRQIRADKLDREAARDEWRDAYQRTQSELATVRLELEDSRVDASDTAGQLGDALSKLDAVTQRAGEAEREVEACHKIMADVRRTTGRPGGMTIQVVQELADERDQLQAALAAARREAADARALLGEARERLLSDDGHHDWTCATEHNGWQYNLEHNIVCDCGLTPLLAQIDAALAPAVQAPPAADHAAREEPETK